MKITVKANIDAPLETVWRAYTNPDDIVQWNAASDDWHTTNASVDLRPGGDFCFRMEARDGSVGFNFAGTYTKIAHESFIEYSFGDRSASVEFHQQPDHVLIQIVFDAETVHSIEQQQDGWQSILNRFKAHVERLTAGGGT